jgi:membrane protein
MFDYASYRDRLWSADVEASGWFRRLGLCTLRFVFMTVSGFTGHRCALHAAGLTYFSLMSLVPVLCLLLSLARLCGVGDFVHEKINGVIETVITDFEKGADELPAFVVKNQKPEEIEARRRMAHDLAVQARNVSNDVFARISRFEVHRIGLAGLLMLMWTAISTLGMVEHAFNEVWDVPRGRPLWKKATLYLMISFVLPFLAALAVSFPFLRLLRTVLDLTFGATVYTKWMGVLLLRVVDSALFGWCFSLVFASLAFTFLLRFMPNRPVSVRASLEGGLLTALLFGGWVKVCALAQVGLARSSAMYGSIALVPIALAWLYMSWQIVLLGGNMTYAFHCLHHRVRVDGAA